MNSKKILAVIAAILSLACIFSACTNKAVDETTTEAESGNVIDGTPIKVSFLKGPTGMGAAQLWTKSDNGETQNNYDITLDTDATTVGPKLMNGEYDIAAIPTNLASSLYSKSQGKIKVIAVNTLGVLYIVSKNDDIERVSDLEGKTILASGQGTIAEYALNYVLDGADLTVGENVKIEFTTEHSESVAKAMAGDYDIVLLPEPFVSQLITKNDSFKPVINLTEEWEKIGDTTLAMGCIAVNSEFYANNKEKIALFLNDYATSVEFVNNNIEEAAQMIESHDIMPAAVAKKAIPNCNIVCFVGDEMKSALSSCYSVLLEQNPKIIGGALPGDDFYVQTAGKKTCKKNYNSIILARTMAVTLCHNRAFGASSLPL